MEFHRNDTGKIFVSSMCSEMCNEYPYTFCKWYKNDSYTQHGCALHVFYLAKCTIHCERHISGKARTTASKYFFWLDSVSEWSIHFRLHCCRIYPHFFPIILLFLNSSSHWAPFLSFICSLCLSTFIHPSWKIPIPMSVEWKMDKKFSCYAAVFPKSCVSDRFGCHRVAYMG